MKRILLILAAFFAALGPLTSAEAQPPRTHVGGREPEGSPRDRAGPPPEAFSMRRGGFLRPDLRGGVVQDPGRFRLRPPPRGYSWVRVGGAFVLMDLSSGQIFDVVTN